MDGAITIGGKAIVRLEGKCRITALDWLNDRQISKNHIDFDLAEMGEMSIDFENTKEIRAGSNKAAITLMIDIPVANIAPDFWGTES